MEEIYIKNAVLNNKSDIPQPFNTLFSLMGFDGILTLCNEFKGSSIYIPSMQSIFKNAISIQMGKEFNGSNYKELSFRYGLTDRTVRNMIHLKRCKSGI